MKAAFHYAVKVKLIRYETKDDIGFIDYEKSFDNEKPIKARQQAFEEYTEWIKDLYNGIGKAGQYTTDRQARIDLQKFTTPSQEHHIQIDNTDFNFSRSVGYGIGVYLIIDQPYYPAYLSKDMYDKPGDEHLLHGIGTTEKYNEPLEISDALNNEILYYKHYQYDKGGFERKTNFFDWNLGETEEISFLETSFDWSGLDENPDSNPVEDTTEAVVNRNQSIKDIISAGEGNQVEFKPALLYNFKTSLAGIGIKAKIATAICAFLNANGGFLFIGLNDDGQPQGLTHDFSLANGKKPKDFFQNEFDQMIEHFLSFSVKANISGQFHKLEDKDVFVVTVEPSKNRAIFVNGREGKEFWVRGNAGNRQLTDLEELANYCIDRWGN
ncbi:MAG: AlbA family DNA-binding domain-containing protein [Bacteroidota bacterium]